MKLLNIIELIKEKIMPRPKGSKNKSTIEQQPREFDYERDDAFFDSNYQQVQTSAPAESWTLTTEETVETAKIAEPARQNSITAESLFLVEGEVQMQPREPGRGSMVAKQFRIVHAFSDEHAVLKFSEYFRGLSDSSGVYTVLRAAAMEAIR
jgi:hypothetical protein